MVNVGGAKKGNGLLENYNNTIILSADRNGSSAFQYDIQPMKINQDSFIFLSECFSQDPEKGQPPNWWDSVAYPPSQVIETINKGTGKSVSLKIQITWGNFNKSYFDIAAKRKIFLHRNLFDSTLSRCIAQKTGLWHVYKDNPPLINCTEIETDFFQARLEYRIEKYIDALPHIYNWATEFYRYENYTFRNKLQITPNPSKKDYILNYKDLFELYNSYNEIKFIETEIEKIEQKCTN